MSTHATKAGRSTLKSSRSAQMDGPQTFTIFEADVGGAENWTYLYDNNSYLYEGGTDCQDGEGLQTFDTMVKPLLYSLIFLLGIAGNGLMVTVLLTRRRHLRITEIYLLQLALADLMLLFTLPFDVVASVTGWLFGEFLCKMMGLLKNLNLLCGSLLIACIGFDRYLAIVHAVPSMQSRRPRVVHQICAVLWLFVLGLSVPNAVFLSLREDYNSSAMSCYFYSHGLHAHNWVLTRRVLHHVCFFLPLAVMSYCYTALAITLCRSLKRENKRGAIRLALLVTVVFCVCWLPYNITLLINTLVDLEVIVYESCDSFLLLQPALDLTETLGILHCCLNPFLYAFVGVRFRNELLELLCKLGCTRVCRPFMKGQGHGRQSISDGTSSFSAVLI